MTTSYSKCLLVVLFLLFSDISTQSQNVNRLCDDVFCIQIEGTVCRAVQNSTSCPPNPFCLPCVPKGIDDVCNDNGYYFAILIGNFSEPSQLSDRKCYPNQPAGLNSSCPEGSVCVSGGSSGGTCCYGKPDPPPDDGSVKNSSIACEKEGDCPVLPAYIPDWCPTNAEHACYSDYDCPNILKCCSNQCGQLECTPRFTGK